MGLRWWLVRATWMAVGFALALVINFCVWNLRVRPRLRRRNGKAEDF